MLRYVTSYRDKTILTYAFTVFPGRMYVTQSQEDLEQLWSDRKMAARTALIEKQLAGWDQIEQVILKCRDWHRLRPCKFDIWTCCQPSNSHM